MSIQQPIIVDRRSSAEASPDAPGGLAAVCRDLDWLEQTARRTAWAAYGGLAAFILTLVLALGLPAALIPDRLHGTAGIWFLSCGIAAVVGVLQLVTLGARLSQPTDRLLRHLELSELAQRIDAGLLEDHPRVRELYMKRPHTLARIGSNPRTRLAYLLGHLDLYLGSAPIMPLPARWIIALAYAFGLPLALGFILPSMLLSGSPIPFLYIAFLPAAWVRPRLDLAPRAAALAAYLREAASHPHPAAGGSRAELERRCRFALDVNQLDIDLKTRLGGYGAAPGMAHVWGAGVLALLALAGGAFGRSPVCLGVGLLLAGTILAAGHWLRREAERYRQRARSWLEDGDYLLRVALEELTADRLAELVPPAWRAWLGNGAAARWPQYRSGLKRTLWAAAFNASWVEAGCRLSRHPGFVALVGFVPAILVGIVVSTFTAFGLAATHGAQGLDVLGVLAGMLALFIVPGVVPLQLHGQRRAIAAEEFVALLQRRLLE